LFFQIDWEERGVETKYPLEALKDLPEMDVSDALALLGDIGEIISREVQGTDWRTWSTHGAWPAVIRQTTIRDGECVVCLDEAARRAWVVAGPRLFIGDLIMLGQPEGLHLHDGTRSLKYYLAPVLGKASV
jgi:hypothetical protein